MTLLPQLIATIGLLAVANSQIILDGGEPYQEWSTLECKATQAMGGFYAVKADTAYGIDWQMSITCWEVDNFAPVDASEDDCQWNAEFEFGGDLSFGSASNCGDGYAAGIRGIWVPNPAGPGKRITQLKCCTPKNAKVDHSIGCHTSFPINISSQNSSLVETPYEHRDTCPNWIAVGYESCGGGVKLLYCPFKVNGAEYDRIVCRGARTTGVELCPSTPFSNWEQKCSPTQTIAGFWSQQITWGEKKDYQFTFFCRDIDDKGLAIVEDEDCEWNYAEHEAKKTVEWDDASNCKGKNQYASGVRGRWDDTGNIRYLKFRCCKAKNARFARGVGCHSTELTPTYREGAPYSGAKSPYEPRYKCPRYVWTATQSCGDGLKVKFCPISIDGEDYHIDQCRGVRTTDFDAEGMCPPPPPPPPGECPVRPWGQCTKECSVDTDCWPKYGERAICCNNDCEDVCFVGVECVQTKCFGTNYCPYDCHKKCVDYLDYNGLQEKLKRLIGWECNDVGNDKQNCCCIFESADPNCLSEVDFKKVRKFW